MAAENEIQWELQWDATFENSQHLLEALAKKALDDFKKGKTKEMGFDEL